MAIKSILGYLHILINIVINYEGIAKKFFTYIRFT